jgi:crotonobetainyl-CoA:carnitine CoA-transferase CaiB-like acyl-CoA transferase
VAELLESAPTGLPLAGLSVVEVAVGCSTLGLGLAGGMPGMILADLGATVVRVVGTTEPAIDEGVAWSRAWHRDKRVVETDDRVAVLGLLAEADVALVYGSEALIEGRGLGYADIATVNPSVVYARCRPSWTSTGTTADFGLLVEARAGFCTQLAGHRPGPIFVDVRAAGGGAALLIGTSVLALLRRRVLGGGGGWSETSLYDGLLSTLGCMIGRSERAPVEVESYWEHGSTFPNFLYRCADGELIQVWFGGKGMYAKLIEVLGDEPSAQGYYRDQATGALGDRAARWRSVFVRQDRDRWIDQLRAVGIACEPVLGPGDALDDPHLAEAGLAITRSNGAQRDVLVATPISVLPLAEESSAIVTDPRPASGGGLLDGVRVLDFSAFVAGPLASQVLADLGADVVKVEPLEGEAMRAAAYAVAAAQRGKRSLALDISAPGAREVVERLIRWADVVLHNFRVGVAERLGIGAADVGRLNPRAVYCHASAFGASGPRAAAPGNDALMQALTGFERAVGGSGNDPIAATWIPIDMCGGWVAALGTLAGLYRAAATGRGYAVVTSLLGAGMLLQSGVYVRDGRCIRQPELDGDQTGYGPGYRLYRGGDENWFALVLPDPESWRRLRTVPPLASVPERYAPLRGGPDDALAREAESVLEHAFAAAPASEWVATLRRLGVPVEPVEALDRDRFRRGILDDPVNRQLGRVVTYATPEWGRFEQIGPLLRCGPSAAGGPPLMLPGVGEHTEAVLAELGFSGDEVQSLLGAKVVRQQADGPSNDDRR